MWAVHESKTGIYVNATNDRHSMVPMWGRGTKGARERYINERAWDGGGIS